MKLKRIFLGGAVIAGIVGLAGCKTTNTPSTSKPASTSSTTIVSTDTEPGSSTSTGNSSSTDTISSSETSSTVDTTESTSTDTTTTNPVGPVISTDSPDDTTTINPVDTTVTMDDPDDTTTGAEAPKVKYLISWYNGETLLDSEEVEEGVVPSYKGDIPTKAEDDDYIYTFSGWNTTPVAATEATSYYAQFSKQSKKETENVGFGGTYTKWTELFSASGSTRVDSKDRKCLCDTDDETFTYNGFTFGGKAVLDSSIMNTQGTSIRVNLPTAGSITMNATWGSDDAGKVYVYKVVDGAETLIYTSSSYSKNSAVSLQFDSMSLEAGEYVIKALKDSNTSSGASLKITTIYYEAIVQYVTVNYVTNSDDTITSTTIKKGSAIGELPTLIKSGYKFDGWYSTSTFTEDSVVTSATKISADTTLYAKWIELDDTNSVTLSFVVVGVTDTTKTLVIEKGNSLSELPSELAYEGYRLDACYLDSGLYQKIDVTTYTFDTDKTIYVNFIKTWNVTFTDQDGNLIDTVTVDDESLVSTSVSAPYIDGYKFAGWVTSNGTAFDVSAEAITSDLVLKATYEVDSNPIAKVSITAFEGEYETAYVTLDTYTLDSNNASSYNVYLTGNGYTDYKLSTDQLYLSTTSTGARLDLFGLKEGNYQVKVVPIVSDQEVQAAYSAVNVDVEAYDRSGYAHFNNTEGVGAYNDDGTLKDNAIVLYVNDDNKNTVNLSFHDSINEKDWSVTGIGNILNSAGKNYNNTGTNSKGGTANTNDGVILALAQNNIPLVVRFVGCVSDSGAYTSKTIDPSSTYLIDGLTEWDSINLGGSEGDAGHMARMQSGKNITFEGVGDDAIIDGWGFHLICESAYPELAKNFEVRNLTFMNTPEDAVGMEGQETESTLTLTAPVEHCWIHHNTFLSPSMSKTPAGENDKAEGDGSCDFKRGRYFTCSYNYFENCHKTNLVGSGKTSVQYCLTYHHNLWYQCQARQPLARKANIHFYNNYIIGTSDTVSSLRADSYMFAEKNYYLGCSRPVEYKAEGGSAGVCKAYENNVIGCFNDYSATEVTNRETSITANCVDNQTGIDYSTFDTDPTKFYYDSTNKCSDCYLTDANQARIDCIEQAGSRYRTKLQKCELSTNKDITDTASTATISGATSLTISKGKGVLKVFTVTSAVTVTMAASASAGFDTGYLLKMDGSVVLKLTASEQTAVLLPGKYVIVSCVAFTPSAKNDKETTITTCTFTEYNSEELNQQLIDEYNTAKNAIPSSITYTDSCYNAIKNAMTKYEALGDLQSQVDYTTVQNAYNQYKALGVSYVESLISAIGTVDSSSASKITAARNAYDTLISKCSDATVSNYSTLTAAEEAFAAYAKDACITAIDAIGTVEYTSECLAKIVEAETLYNSLDNTAKAQVTNYSVLTAARAQYDSLGNIADVEEELAAASTLAECEAAKALYDALTTTEKASVDSAILNSFNVRYTIALINSISSPVVRADKTTVEAARALYDSLDATYQAQVTNIATLEAAEEALAGMTAEEVTKTLSASDFTITGVSTTAFSGNVWSGGSIVGISKVTYTDPSKIVLNAIRGDKSVTFKVSYSTDGSTWTSVGEQTPGSNNSAADLTYTISATGDVYIKIEILCTKGESTAKLGTINTITLTYYE